MSLYDKMASAGQYDDGLTTRYEVLPDVAPTHIQHNGIGRTAVQMLAGASGLGVPVKSVWLRFRKMTITMF
jgi:hypothetical protein